MSAALGGSGQEHIHLDSSPSGESWFSKLYKEMGGRSCSQIYLDELRDLSCDSQENAIFSPGQVQCFGKARFSGKSWLKDLWKRMMEKASLDFKQPYLSCNKYGLANLDIDPEYPVKIKPQPIFKSTILSSSKEGWELALGKAEKILFELAREFKNSGINWHHCLKYNSDVFLRIEFFREDGYRRILNFSSDQILFDPDLFSQLLNEFEKERISKRLLDEERALKEKGLKDSYLRFGDSTFLNVSNGGLEVDGWKIFSEIMDLFTAPDPPEDKFKKAFRHLYLRRLLDKS